MTNYLIRRVLQMIVVILVSTIMIFGLLNAIPGGPLSGINMAADAKSRFTEEDIARMKATLGLNKPWWLAYMTWTVGEDWVDEVGGWLGDPDLSKLSNNPDHKLIFTGTWSDYQSPRCTEVGGSNAGIDVEEGQPLPCRKGILRGDYGVSWRMSKGQTVWSMMKGRLTNTIRLMTTVSILSLVIATPIGIISAVRQYSWLDYGVTLFSFFGIAMPSFWFGLLLIIIFGLQCNKWGIPCMPTGDVTTIRVVKGSMVDVLGINPGSFADYIIHMIMPVTMLSLLSLAGWSRFMRSSMLEVLRQDYVRTARAKGLREQMVILKHAARNALIPLVTIVVFEIPGIFGGAIITETIFNYPGMGHLFITALNSNDWPIVMGFLFISSILVVIATLVGDVLYTIVDPRIRFG